MKIKTKDLIGAQLDWAVAKCEGEAKIINGETWLATGNFFSIQQCIFHPSTIWAQGGPIIERENLQIERSSLHNGWFCNKWRDPYLMDSRKVYADGPTPLLAAMRCYVASKLGDEVEIPEELA